MLRQLHVYHDDDPRSAALNMAVDEALLQLALVPSLRFYRWRTPSLSFGYFGTFQSVAEYQASRDLVRRWTGGGTVLHGTDFTYSLILPAGAAATSRSVYRFVHEAVRRALGERIRVTLADAAAPKISEACFANPVAADVMSNGHKIAGAAQRRTRAGLLHQGSIQLAELPTDFAQTFAKKLCGSCERQILSSEILYRAERIAAERYATDAWLHLR